jgi:HEAT repeat protein
MPQTAPAKPQGGQRPPVPQAPPEFQAEKIMKLDAAGAVAILQDSAATEFQKSKACMRLAQVGTKDAVPALAALLGNERLSDYARFGLVPLPDPSVDLALRNALTTTKGQQRIGVVDSIGQRKDAGSIVALSKLLYSTDVALAEAAAAALGQIGGAQAVAALSAALAKTKGPVRNAAAAASLVAADGLVASGDRKGGLALYHALSGPDLPKPVRLAAMHLTIEVETAINRPRTAPPSRN